MILPFPPLALNSAMCSSVVGWFLVGLGAWNGVLSSVAMLITMLIGSEPKKNSLPLLQSQQRSSVISLKPWEILKVKKLNLNSFKCLFFKFILIGGWQLYSSLGLGSNPCPAALPSGLIAHVRQHDAICDIFGGMFSSLLWGILICPFHRRCLKFEVQQLDCGSWKALKISSTARWTRNYL